MKILIVNGSPQYAAMFREAGHTLVLDINGADLIQFTGGEDVSPILYGEPRHPHTYNNPNRDTQEEAIFTKAVGLGIPMVGICRGGQFLNVMNGGKMWQHAQGHAINGTHKAFDVWTKEVVNVTSTHHQIMRNGPNGVVVAVADGLSNNFESMDEAGGIVSVEEAEEVEVVWYPRTKSLCFQPHPEFHDAKDCRDYYFDCIQRYILEGK